MRHSIGPLHPVVAISLLALAAMPAFGGPRTAKSPPRLALFSHNGGEHTVEALAEIGYDEETIARMLAAGVIGTFP